MYDDFVYNLPDVKYLLQATTPNTYEGLKLKCFGENQESVDSFFDS